MKKKGFTLEAQMASPPYWKKDNSIKVSFTSLREMSAEEVETLRKFPNMPGWLLFSPNELEAKDIPKEPAPEDNFESPSSRLRKVIYVWWESAGMPGPDEMTDATKFEMFYRDKVEWYIQQIKDKKLPKR